MVAVIQASQDSDLKEIKPYLKFINQWTDDQFWGVYGVVVSKVIASQKAGFASKPSRVKANFHYDKSYSPEMLKRAAAFRNK